MRDERPSTRKRNPFGLRAPAFHGFGRGGHAYLLPLTQSERGGRRACANISAFKLPSLPDILPLPVLILPINKPELPRCTAASDLFREASEFIGI